MLPAGTSSAPGCPSRTWYSLPACLPACLCLPLPAWQSARLSIRLPLLLPLGAALAPCHRDALRFVAAQDEEFHVRQTQQYLLNPNLLNSTQLNSLSLTHSLSLCARVCVDQSVLHWSRYCRGDFATWDPMITTFPGLYLFTVGLLQPAAALLGQAPVASLANVSEFLHAVQTPTP